MQHLGDDLPPLIAFVAEQDRDAQRAGGLHRTLPNPPAAAFAGIVQRALLFEQPQRGLHRLAIHAQLGGELITPRQLALPATLQQQGPQMRGDLGGDGLKSG